MDTRVVIWFRGLCVAVALSMPLFGNGCAATATPKPRASSRSEAVVIDFYAGSAKSAACSGTLLAQNVVLTAAHCTDGSTSARVIAPNAGGKRVSVNRVYRYDWTPADPSMDPTHRNDLALLILRQPIELSAYAKIESRACPGCKVRLVGRTHDDEGALEDVTEAPTTTIARNLPAGRPLNLFVDRGISDTGGAVFRQAAGKKKLLVGLTVGRGLTTHGGYVARMDNPEVQSWIRSVVFTASRKQTTPGSKPMDDEGGGDTGGGDDWGGGGDYEDPIDNDTGSGDYGSGDPGAGDEGSGDYGEGTGYDPNDPSGGDPSEQQSGNPETPEESSGQQSGDPETPNDSYQNGEGEGQAPMSPEQVASQEQPPKNPKDPTSPSSKPPKEPPPDDYVEPLSIQYTPTPDAQGQWLANNLYIDSKPGDPAFKNTQAYAQKLESQNATVYGAHGYPGQIAATADPMVATQLMQGGKEVVLASCFAGALPNESGAQKSNAANFASEAGGDPAKVYGCTSYAYSFSGSMGCYGNWVDGSGQFVSDEKKQQLGLKTCTPGTWKNGLPYGSESLCQ